MYRIKKFTGAFLFLVVLMNVAEVAAQASITGKVISNNGSQPLQDIAVVLTSASDEIAIAGAVTDQAGQFVFSGIEPGNYLVSTDNQFYSVASQTILVGTINNYYNLGDMVVSRIPSTVEEVTVTGQQIVSGNSIDRRIFDLSTNFAQSTGSILDAMKTLPGVTVEQEGKITMRGSDRVVILIDGKQSGITGYGNQSGLDSIPASNIESIEVINNPSSRYDAAGMAGIINIKYKENIEYGWTGDWGLTFGVGAITKPKEDLPTDLGSYSQNLKINPSLNLNYNTGEGKSYFIRASFLDQERLPNNEFTTRFYDDGRVVLSQVPENRVQQHTTINIGADWLLNNKHEFLVQAVYDIENHEDNAQVPFIDQDTMTRNRYWYWTEKEQTGHFNINIDYTYLFDEPGHELSVNSQYTRGWEDEDYYLNEESNVRLGTDATYLDATEHTLPIQIDYTHPLSNGRFELGSKIQKRWIPVTYDVDRGVDSVIYSGLGDWSDWSEDIYAFYGNYIIEKPKFDVEAGVRIEQTDVTYEFSDENIYYDENDKYDYFEVFPNTRFTYNLDDDNRLALFYNRRVDRPGEPELRIFAKYDDPELLKVGNPYLRPQFTTSYEVSYEHLWESGSLMLSAYIKDIEDHFLRVYSQDLSDPNYDIVNKIYQNAGDATNKGLELLFSQDISETWRVSGSLNWYNSEIEAYQAEILFPYRRPLFIESSKDDTWDFKVNNQIYLPWNIEGQISLIYYAARNIEQGTQRARSSIDVGLKRPFLQDRGEIIFSFTDVLNDFGLEQEVKGDGFSAIYENYYETQVLSLGFKYNF